MSSTSPTRATQMDAAWWTLAAGLLLAVAQPWEPQPFDVLDYSEFLPILQQSSSFADGAMSLIGYYGEHGRWSPITHAFIAGNWFLFGEATQPWLWVRVGLAFVNSVLLFALTRRLGLSRASAGLSSLLIIVITPASAAWIRLSGEPLGLLFMLAALLAGSRYAEGRQWRTRGLAIAGLSLLAILVKETLILAAPIVIAFAISWDGARLGRPAPSARNRWLLMVSAGTLAAAGAAIVFVASASGPGGYAATYGDNPPTVSYLLALVLLMVMPVQPGTADPVLVVAGSVLAAALLILAFATWIEGRDRNAGRARLAGYLLLLPLAGALTYLPWPRFEPFYALPYAIGSVSLLAASHSCLQRSSRPAAWIGRALGLALVGLCSLASFNAARSEAAARRLDRALIQRLVEYPGIDTVLVGVRTLPPQEWQGSARTLSRFARATEYDGTPFGYPADALCDEVRRRVSEGRGVVGVHYERVCDPGYPVWFELSEVYRRFHLAQGRLDRDTLRVSVTSSPQIEEAP